MRLNMESIMERTRERRKWAKQLQRGLLSQQELFHKASKDTDAAFKAGYVISQLIAKVGKPFNEEEERKKKVCSTTLLSANNVAERNNTLSSNIYEQRSKFHCHSVALDESTDNAQQFSSEVLIISLRWQKKCWVCVSCMAQPKLEICVSSWAVWCGMKQTEHCPAFCRPLLSWWACPQHAAKWTYRLAVQQWTEN